MPGSETQVLRIEGYSKKKKPGAQRSWQILYFEEVTPKGANKIKIVRKNSPVWQKNYIILKK